MTVITDTTELVRVRHRALIASLPPAERLLRAFSLSAFLRDVAWAGAQRAAGDRGPVAVRERFLTQLYGPHLSDALRALVVKL